MRISVSAQPTDAGALAAERGGGLIRAAIADRGGAVIVVATGASQFAMYDTLVKLPDIDWKRVTMFHLDEYIGIPVSHPASFRGYLLERFIGRLPAPLKQRHLIHGEADPVEECSRLGALIAAVDVDVAFIGIGENAHLAFNDPPADFDATDPYLVVGLDEACRRQQLGEGWFSSLDEVPKRAISMSVQQILKATKIVCTAPDARKAEAVRGSLEGPVHPSTPASILQRHPGVSVFLDAASASQLKHPPGAANHA